jgi:hypothetical protein
MGAAQRGRPVKLLSRNEIIDGPIIPWHERGGLLQTIFGTALSIAIDSFRRALNRSGSGAGGLIPPRPMPKGDQPQKLGVD